ncbi:glycosyl transferase [Bosea caraganae]|uniref:Glycosyl transferase n=1 Tax=Bosea caraganae TaxID=2763117 RepID=A0A370L994_9HYPH|nr:glycosyl transferase [Bosea caraganae]RDJ30855.1 glycosyl transferase [Bosea caraganae]
MIAVAAAAAAGRLCVLLRPLLVRYALARPNARSSHRIPTPQGGGIAVLAGAFLALGLVLLFMPLPAGARDTLLLVMAASVLLAIVGAWDDIKPLPAWLRLILQALCVGLVLLYAAPDVRLFPALPLPLERALALFAGVWFVNLTNFMDGIDWITVMGIVPLCGALALCGILGPLDQGSGLLAAALLGGLVGFAPFNKPSARLFLGDVGSLPIGLLTAYLLYRLAGTGALTAALILPLYHVLDSTITLLRRLARGEKVWEAHRSHFYQQATNNGYAVSEIVAQVALLNLGLIVLGAMTIAFPNFWVQFAGLFAALLLTGILLRRFSRKRFSLAG